MKLAKWVREGFRRLVADATEGKDVVVAAAPVVPVGQVFRRFWPHARSSSSWPSSLP